MENRGIKRTAAVLLCAVFLTAAGLLYVFIRDTRYEKVEEGISLDEAISMVQNDDRYLIAAGEYTTGVDFRIVYGKHEGEYIQLCGRSPLLALGNTFFFGASNSFLLLTDNGRYIDNPYEALAVDELYTVDVVSWKLITPIQRSYHFRSDYEPLNNGRKSRWFAPKDYLDAFDVEQGDYVIS